MSSLWTRLFRWIFLKSRRRRLVKEIRRAIRLHLEVMEDRLTPASASLDSLNDLVVTTNSSAGQANQFFLALRGNGTTIVVSDPTEVFANPNISGAWLSNGGTILNVPVSSITGASIILQGVGGNDQLNVDVGTALGYTVNCQGSGADSLSLTSSFSVATVTHTFLNATDGSVDISSVQSIVYTGLRSIADNLIATNRIFNYTGGDKTITVSPGTSLADHLASTQGVAVDFSNPTGSLTIDGSSANDTINFNGLDPGFNADLSIDGLGGADTLTMNGALAPGADKNITLHAGTIHFQNYLVATTGTGMLQVTADQNILVDQGASLSTEDGDMALSANTGGSASGGLAGIEVDNATLVATGTANITLTGRGGASAGDGIALVNSSASLAGGNISLTGMASYSATGDGNRGVFLDNSQVGTTGTGSITVDGTGSSGGTNDNRGVYLTSATQLQTAAGAIQITGYGGGNGNGDANDGIRADLSSAITSTSGAISLGGTGGPGVNDNAGIALGDGDTTNGGTQGAIVQTGGNITFTGTAKAGTTGKHNVGVLLDISARVTATGTGTLGISGTGGGGTDENYGVGITGATLQIDNTTLQISTWVSAWDTGDHNDGIYVSSATIIQSTQAGAISLAGTGAGQGLANAGIEFGGGSTIQTGGTILLAGIGSASGSANSDGIDVYGGSTIQATGAGDITLNGTSGNGAGGSNVGVSADNSTVEATAGGNIFVTGSAYSFATGDGNRGVFLGDTQPVTVSTMAGDITVQGTGGISGTNNNQGVLISTASQLQTGTGNIQITATAGSSNPNVATNVAMEINQGGTLNTTGGGSITVLASSMTFDSSTGAAINAGAGYVTLLPVSSWTVSLGGADSASQLGLDNNDLQAITAGHLLIGTSTSPTGAITVDANVDVSTGVANLDLTSNATISGSSDLTANSVGLTAPGGVDLEGDNAVATLAVASPYQNITFHAANGFDIGTVDGVAGLNASLNAPAALVTLTNDNGTVTNSYPISAAQLLLHGAGAFNLNNQANAVDQLAGDSTGTVTFVDASDLQITTLAGVVGVGTPGQSLSLTANSLTANCPTGDLDIGASNLVLSASAGIGDATAAAALTINATTLSAKTSTGNIGLEESNAVSVNLLAAPGPNGTVYLGNLNPDPQNPAAYTIHAGTLAVASALNPNTTYLLDQGAVLNLGSFRSTVAGFSLIDGIVDGTANGHGTLKSMSAFDVRSGTVTANATLDGPAGLTKTTASTVFLEGINTYTGFTQVNEGTLQVDGQTSPGSPVYVEPLAGATAVLRGTGTVWGAVDVLPGGILETGNTTSQFTLGSLQLFNDSVVNLRLGGPAPSGQGAMGTGYYDQINVNTGVSLFGTPILNVTSFGGFQPTANQSFLLIKNNSSNPISGNGLFTDKLGDQGVADGGVFLTNFLGTNLTSVLTYHGGDGNDVVLYFNHAPAISGDLPNQPVHDNNTTGINPFTSLTIQDSDTPAQTLTVTVQISNPANGTLTNLGGFIPPSANNPGGPYTFTGTAAQAQAAINGLVFIPTDHQVAPGDTVTTDFIVTVSDGIAPTVTDSLTSVVATSIEDAPVTSNPSFSLDVNTALQVNLNQPLYVTDPDVGQTLSFTLLSAPKHYGTFQLTTSGQLTYTPKNNYLGTDSFTYQVSDGILTSTATVSLSVNFVDSFNRPDGTALSGQWGSPSRGTPGFTIVSNTAVASTTSSVLATGLSTTDVAVQADVSDPGVQTGLLARDAGGNYYLGMLHQIGGTYYAEIWKKVAGVSTRLAQVNDISLSNTGSDTLCFEVIANSLKLFFDGKLVAFAHDGSLKAAGGVGLYTVKPNVSKTSVAETSFSNFSATPLATTAVTLPLPNSFGTGSQLNSAWLDQTGNFLVSGGVAQGNALLSVATLNGLGKVAGNVTLSANVSLTSPQTGQVGLVARYGASGYYWAGVVEVKGQLFAEIDRFDSAGVKHMLKRSLLGQLVSGTGPLTFAVSGNSLTLSINGTVVSVTDKTITGPGLVGMRADNGQTIAGFQVATN